MWFRCRTAPVVSHGLLVDANRAPRSANQIVGRRCRHGTGGLLDAVLLVGGKACHNHARVCCGLIDLSHCQLLGGVALVVSGGDVGIDVASRQIGGQNRTERHAGSIGLKPHAQFVSVALTPTIGCRQIRAGIIVGHPDGAVEARVPHIRAHGGHYAGKIDRAQRGCVQRITFNLCYRCGDFKFAGNFAGVERIVTDKSQAARQRQVVYGVCTTTEGALADAGHGRRDGAAYKSATVEQRVAKLSDEVIAIVAADSAVLLRGTETKIIRSRIVLDIGMVDILGLPGVGRAVVSGRRCAGDGQEIIISKIVIPSKVVGPGSNMVGTRTEHAVLLVLFDHACRHADVACARHCA